MPSPMPRPCPPSEWMPSVPLSPRAVERAQQLAHELVRAAGATPCTDSEFVWQGRLFVRSRRSTTFRPVSGPAVEITVDIATLRVVR